MVQDHVIRVIATNAKNAALEKMPIATLNE